MGASGSGQQDHVLESQQSEVAYELNIILKHLKEKMGFVVGITNSASVSFPLVVRRQGKFSNIQHL